MYLLHFFSGWPTLAAITYCVHHLYLGADERRVQQRKSDQTSVGGCAQGFIPIYRLLVPDWVEGTKMEGWMIMLVSLRFLPDAAQYESNLDTRIGGESF